MTWRITGIALVGFVAGIGLLTLAKPMTGLIAILGIIVAAAVMTWPIVGVAMIIFCATCLQLLGSSHITGLPISLGKLFGFLTMGAWVYDSVRHRRTFVYSPQMVALGAFLLIAIASTIYSPVGHHAQERFDIAVEGVSVIINIYILFFLIANISAESRTIYSKAIAAVTIGASICGVIGLIEYFMPTMAFETADPKWGQNTGRLGALVDETSIPGVEFKRVTGGIGEPNWLGITLAVTLPLCVIWWWRFRSFLPRCAVLLSVLLQLAGATLSFTRASFVGLGAATLYLFWKRRLPLAPIGALGLICVVMAMIWIPPGFVERMFSAKYLKEGSTPYRKELAAAAVHAWLEKPMWGHGYGQFGAKYMEYVRSSRTEKGGSFADEVEGSIQRGQERVENVGTHIMYLEVLVEYGLMGMVPFVMFLWFIRTDAGVVEQIGTEEDKIVATCLTASLISFCVCALFGHIKILKILWIVAGLAAGLRHLVLTQQPVNTGAPVSPQAPSN